MPHLLILYRILAHQKYGGVRERLFLRLFVDYNNPRNAVNLRLSFVFPVSHMDHWFAYNNVPFVE